MKKYLEKTLLLLYPKKFVLIKYKNENKKLCVNFFIEHPRFFLQALVRYSATFSVSFVVFAEDPDVDDFFFEGINARICAKEIIREKIITNKNTTLYGIGVAFADPTYIEENNCAKIPPTATRILEVTLFSLEFIFEAIFITWIIL